VWSSYSCEQGVNRCLATLGIHRLPAAVVTFDVPGLHLFSYHPVFIVSFKCRSGMEEAASQYALPQAASTGGIQLGRGCPGSEQPTEVGAPIEPLRPTASPQ